MPRFLHPALFILLITFCFSARSQTVLNPGDIVVLGIMTELGGVDGCGLPLNADEISFVCLKDIETGTTIDVTDNGWEHTFANFWGDSEGTLQITRTGPTVPKGTVMTFRGWDPGTGVWTYRMMSPDVQWTFTNLNIPGGYFNMENGGFGAGGDQVYFMQGGVWNNQGGGANRAIYDGRMLWAANTDGDWNADGTIFNSNLHPGVLPCYYTTNSVGLDKINYVKYIGPLGAAQLDWFPDVQNPSYWATYKNCNEYSINAPDLVGMTISFEESAGMTCFLCYNCAPFTEWFAVDLPPGEYNVTYYVGSETYTLMAVTDGYFFNHLIEEDVEFGILSIESTDNLGCIIYSNFAAPDSVNSVHTFNAGTYTELWLCENYPGALDLDIIMPHDPGGYWFGLGFGATEGLWTASDGDGIFTYYIPHPDNTCFPPYDSASVRIHTVKTDGTTIEVSCGQNGTPNNIFDDVIILTLNVNGEHFGPDYTVSISSGTITPTSGLAGVPTEFTLSPGSATGPNLTLGLFNSSPPMVWPAPPYCFWQFPIIPPGFCSDPCDYEMSATAEVSGSEDVCINNCPDDPAVITVQVEGGTPPYQMDFTVTSPGSPSGTFTGIPINDFNEIEVCVGQVAVPTFNAASFQLFVPASYGEAQLEFTLTNVYDKYGCTHQTGNDVTYLTIHDLPKIDTISLKLCSEEARVFDLTQYDLEVSPFYDVTWYDGNPLGAGEEINFPAFVNLNNVVELWASIEDDYCTNALQMNLQIFPSPDIDSIPPVEICSGGEVVLQSITITDIAESEATYTFHSGFPLDTSTLLDPLHYVPADSTTIYLLATAEICFDTVPIAINVQDYPDFTLQSTPCNLLNDTWSAVFISNGATINANVGTVVNNPAGADQVTGIPENVNVSIEIISASGLCKDTFLIVAPNCNCPLIPQPASAQPQYEICEGSPIPVFTVTVDPGKVANWYDVPSGGIALLTNSLTFTPASATSATYYAEAFDPADGCYSIRTAVPFIVNPVAELQPLADRVLCEDETIDFNTLAPGILNGVGGTGSWFDLGTNQPVSGTVQPQNGDDWYYVFNSNPGNCPSRDTISALVNPLPVIDIHEIICDENTLTYDLYFTTDADGVLATSGTLIQIPSTDSFHLQSIAFDTDIQFTLTNSVTGCDNSIAQAAPDCSCPALLQETDFDACTATGDIDLTAFEGFGVTGNWQIVSTPAGGNPATLSGKIFQGQGADDGLYVLRFVRAVILMDCVDSALFQLTLHESPFADAGSDGTACAPDDIVLTGTGGGSNAQLSWQTTGSGSITNPNTLNTTYSPSLGDITSGSVSFTLTAVDPSGSCPSAQETIDISIDGTAYYILDPATQTYCDTADITVDFDDLITFGTTSGNWFFPDTVSAPIVANSQFNPTTLPAGNYTLFYTSTNAVFPCENDTQSVNLIIENCLCPSVALSQPTQALCDESDTQNLDDFLITSEDGSWTIVGTPTGSSPATISGSTFTTNSSDAGIYRIRYTLDNPVSGCDEFAEITIEVIETPLVQVISVDCADDLQSWTAVVQTTAEDVVNTLGTLTSLGGNRYRIDNITINTPLQINASNSNGLCSSSLSIPSPDCDCTLAIANLPDDAALCPDESITFTPNVTGGKGAVTNFWIVADDSLYQSSLQVSQGGTYQFVSFDELGCKEEHLINVTIYEEMIADVTMTDVTCPGDKDGTITLHDIAGGNGPYFIGFNGGNAQEILSFPHQINNLAAGNYQIEITDGFSCLITLNVVIESASSGTLSLGPDQTILVGDSVFIAPAISFAYDDFFWSGDVEILDTTHLDNWVKPTEDKTIQLTVIDPDGCVYTDELKIRVLLNSGIFVPSVFSPNGDGVNDFITPMTDPSITEIVYFEVFTRWGELIYSQTNFPSNQSTGWDGTLKNKPLMPGVYVYRLKAFNKKGREYDQYGDITLVR